MSEHRIGDKPQWATAAGTLSLLEKTSPKTGGNAGGVCRLAEMQDAGGSRNVASNEPASRGERLGLLDRILARLSDHAPWATCLIPMLRAYIRYAPFAAGKAWLWARVIEPHFAWNDYRFVCQTRSAGRFSGNTLDILQQYLFYFGVWEPNLSHWIMSRLRNGDTFVDVGANIGYYSLLASRLVGPEGSVVAIEPSPAIFEQLRENLRWNGVTNARTLNRAVSDSEGVARLFRGPATNTGLSTIVVVEAALNDCRLEGEVATASLSALLTSDEVHAARIIKIDVEGAEWQVVCGMRPLFCRARHDLEIMVEACPQRLARQGRSATDLLAAFEDAGFHAYVIENDYAAASYLARRSPQPPKRLRRPLEHEADLVFSRVDAEVL